MAKGKSALVGDLVLQPSRVSVPCQACLLHYYSVHCSSFILTEAALPPCQLLVYLLSNCSTKDNSPEPDKLFFNICYRRSMGGPKRPDVRNPGLMQVSFGPYFFASVVTPPLFEGPAMPSC